MPIVLAEQALASSVAVNDMSVLEGLVQEQEKGTGKLRPH